MITILQVERFQYILNEINKKGFVKIDDICEKMDVSISTIRRDIDKMSKMGKLLKMNGGAVAISNKVNYEAPFEITKNQNIDEKKRIASVASNYIKENGSYIFDSGATVLELARAVKDKHNIKIVTNDLITANLLSKNNKIDLTVLGGDLRKNFHYMIGSLTGILLQHIHVDRLFMGVDSVDINKGIMTYNTEELEIKRKMMEAANHITVLADHSKFGKKAFAKICELEKVDLIITGNQINDEIYKEIGAAGVSIELA